MKKQAFVSIALFFLGFIFEFLYLGTDKMFFIIKFWVLGIVCIVAGTFGILWYVILPLVEERAEKLGKIKKDNINKKK